MKKKSQSRRDLLVLAILTLITILTWIGVDAYLILTRRETPQVVEKELAPLNPKIKTEVFDYLENKR